MTYDCAHGLRGAVLGLTAFFALGISDVRADLKLCNSTAGRVGVAIGYQDNTGWATEG